MELIVPAGSSEAVRAAVHEGADAVAARLDLSGFIRAGFLTDSQFSAAADYCRLRGVKLLLSLENYLRDDELPGAVSLAGKAMELGADGALVSDPGLMRSLAQSLPLLSIRAGLRAAAHDLAGVTLLASLGAGNVTLAPELTAGEIRDICAASPVPCTVYVYGDMCSAASGLCWLASMTGHRSANIHTCERVCRKVCGFGLSSDTHQLSMKTCSLLEHIPELMDMGVASVCIDGRLKRPEYTAMLTGLSSGSIKQKLPPPAKDVQAFASAFPDAGGSDAYFVGKPASELFGWSRQKHGRIPGSVRASYMDTEVSRVPVTFYGVVRQGVPAQLAVSDHDGNNAVVSGPVPTRSGGRELNTVGLTSLLYNTAGTVYLCEGVKASIDPGLFIGSAEINDMKNRALDALSGRRSYRGPVHSDGYHPPVKMIDRRDPPEITVGVQTAAQLSPELAGLKPSVLYVPVGELLASPTSVTPFWENGYTEICAALPPIMRRDDAETMLNGLDKLRSIHVHSVLAGNLGQVEYLKRHDFNVRLDFTANIYNSQTLKAARELGAASAGVSFELELADVRELSKCIDVELLIYGRLPLMYTGACLIKAGTGVCGCGNAMHLRDIRGASLPVIRQPGCRTLVLSENKLFLANRRRDFDSIGLWAGRLNFTTENARECVAVTARYYKLGSYEPVARTKGRYYG